MNQVLHLNGKLKLIVTTLLVLCAYENMAQQRMQFTQYMFNGLVINPAYAGAEEALSLTFIHRSQWVGVDNAPSTQTLSAHTLFKKKHTGLGVTLTNDKIGVHKYFGALTNYAYHLKTGERSYLSMGIGLGIHNQKSDYASIINGVNYDPKAYSGIVSRTFFDLATGVYLRTPKLHIGISTPELIPQKLIYDTITIQLSKTNFFLFSRYTIMVNKNIDIEPSILLKYLSGVPFSYDINMNLIFRKVLSLGLSYRKTESIDLLLKAQVTPQLQFGYAYDHAIGEAANLSSGSHELIIHYLFSYVQRNVQSPR